MSRLSRTNVRTYKLINEYCCVDGWFCFRFLCSNGEIFQITWLIEAAAFLIAAVTIPLCACVCASVRLCPRWLHAELFIIVFSEVVRQSCSWEFGLAVRFFQKKKNRISYLYLVCFAFYIPWLCVGSPKIFLSASGFFESSTQTAGCTVCSDLRLKYFFLSLVYNLQNEQGGRDVEAG